MPLFIVATPIGNLEDVTARSARILAEADEVLAEDTRHSAPLLRHLGIHVPSLKSFHDHSTDADVARVMGLLREGANVALISDAGTPCISDPGYRLVAAARAEGLPVVPVPGPSALIAFLSAAGLPTDRFFFEGFLPSKSGARSARLGELLELGYTVVCYEAPHRLEATLSAIAELDERRAVVVSRELTKLHEDWVCGTPRDVADTLRQREAFRGEIVLGIAPAPRSDEVGDGELEAWVSALTEVGLNPRSIADVLAARLEVKRRAAYQLALHLAKQGGSQQ